MTTYKYSEARKLFICIRKDENPMANVNKQYFTKMCINSLTSLEHRISSKKISPFEIWMDKLVKEPLKRWVLKNQALLNRLW